MKFQPRSWLPARPRTIQSRLRLEQLETREVPAVIVTPTTITTPYDKIPNFGGSPTISAVASGAWSNPATWSTGLVPAAGDIVSIPSGDIVSYDANSTIAIKTVAIQTGGSLRFRTDITTNLTVSNLLVMEGGELQIGTMTNPVAPSVKATVIFADVPLDLASDPQQYGNGLIAFGKITIYGSTRSDAFVRLGAEPLAGATSLTLSSPVSGWNVGDRLVLPDTRQLTNNQRWTAYTSQLETPSIASISPNGLTITLSQPLVYNHLGAHSPDGAIEYQPHVAVLTRNVAFRSQNNFGTRGYVMFAQRVEVDIHNAAFQGLGRTTNTPDDDTTFDTAGVVTHVGTNQSGRYPVYFNHVFGAAGGAASGYQFTFVGNAVTCQMNPQPYRWGVTLNDSSYGLIQDNVIYNWAGAGVAGITGSEINNLFLHNFVAAVKGDDSPRNNTGRDASGFWMVGFCNSFRDNVVTDAVCTYQGIVAGVGYNLYCPPGAAANTRVPLYAGADTSVAGQYKLINRQQQPIAEFTRNEVYGACASGLTLWHLGTNASANMPIAQSVIKDFLAWNVWEEGFFGYPIHNVLFDGFTVIGDPALASNGGGVGWDTGDYWASDVVIRRADIHGMTHGIGGIYHSPGTLRIENSVLRNYREEIWIPNQATYGGPVAPKYPRITIIDNVRFVAYPGAPAKDLIKMKFSTAFNGNDYTQRDEVYVLNFNGTTGDNFQLYYLEQAPTFIMPQTTYYGPDANSDGIGDWIENKGSPVAGLTNAQTWSAYGIAIAGQISPTSQTRANVYGFVRPITSLAGVTVQPGAAAYLSEGGASDSYGFALLGQPTGNVTIQLNPDSQLAVSPATLVFTPQNWATQQYAGISAFDDAIVEFSHAGTLHFAVTSSDPNYQGYVIPDRVITLHDNDTAFGLNVSPSTALSVTEGGTPGTMSVALLSQPTANVTVTLSPNNQLTLNPTSLTFTPQNWKTTQSVTVTAVNDTVVESNHSGTIQFSISSYDPLYQGLATPSRTVSIIDNDFLYDVLVTPGAAAFLYEGGTGRIDGFALSKQPAANVTIQVLPDAQLTASVGSLVFTPANWSTKQNVTITAVNDTVAEGIHSGTVRFTVTSTDSNYQGLAVANQVIALRDNDLVRVYATGADAGMNPAVRIFDPATQTEKYRFDAYMSGYRGGVRIAVGDVNGDGFQDVITGAGPGGGPHVRVFSGKTGNVLTEFFAFAPTFSGGVWLGSGDINNDGYSDIIVGAGPGGGPHVRVFSGKDQSILTEFFAYTASFLGGVHVSSGDVDGDGYSDLVLGAGPGGGPHVRVVSGKYPAVDLASYFAYAPSFTGGVWVSAGDVDGDGKSEVIVSAGAGGGPHVIVFKPQTATIVTQFFAYAPAFAGGVRTATTDLDGDGRADLILAPGSGMTSLVQYKKGTNLASLGSVTAFDPAFLGGVFVG